MCIFKTLGPFIALLFIFGNSFAQEYPRTAITTDRNLGEFSGRFSKINPQAQLARIRVQFDNLRWLNPGDRVQFWTDARTNFKCTAVLKGKSNDYMLVSIVDYDRCLANAGVTAGAYVFMYSQDLVNNIDKGKETIDLMIKRRMALGAKKRRLEKQLEAYVNKVEAVNKRYEVLRAKLEKEWRQSLLDLEEDKSVDLRDFKNTEIKLGELDYKLERYRVSDQNLELDRWSLDKRLYFKK